VREGGALQQERDAARAARALAPWLAAPELFAGPGTRRLRELAEQIDPAKEPVLGVLALARALEAAGDAQGAEGVLRDALAARPAEVVLLDALGKLLEAQRPPRLAGAIECYKAARVARPGLGIALAKVLREANRAAEGEAVIRDLVRREHDNPEVYFHLGAALRGQKRFAEAEA